MKCIACGGPVEKAFSLGEQGLANWFPRTRTGALTTTRFPLGLSECSSCGWMQLTDPVGAEGLFGGEYPYRTLTVPAWVKEVAIRKPGFVVEAGSNDGMALKEFKERGCRTLGVDPAKNMAEEARARGILTWTRYFDEQTAREIVADYGQADVFFGRHVFAHVPDPVSFLDGVRILLKDDGLAFIEVPSGDAFVRDRLVDTLYHEHRSVIHGWAMAELLERCGFRLTGMKTLDIHGGSVLYMFEKGAGIAVSTPRPRNDWEAFWKDVEENRRAFRELLAAWKKQGFRVGAYTAPAKGNVWMQFCGVTTEDIPWVADWTPEKIGKFCPGTGIPVVDPEEIGKRDPDKVVVFAWNWLEKIAAEWKHRGQLVRPYGWAKPMGVER